MANEHMRKDVQRHQRNANHYHYTPNQVYKTKIVSTPNMGKNTSILWKIQTSEIWLERGN